MRSDDKGDWHVPIQDDKTGTNVVCTHMNDSQQQRNNLHSSASGNPHAQLSAISVEHGKSIFLIFLGAEGVEKEDCSKKQVLHSCEMCLMKQLLLHSLI